MLRLFAAAVLALAPAVAQADEINDHLEASRKHYADGRHGRASTELQYALVKLRAKVDEQLRAALPPPPQFWRVDPRIANLRPTGNMFGGQFTVVYRTEVAPNSQVTLQVTTEGTATYGGVVNLALLNPFQAQLQGYTLIEIEGLAYPALYRSLGPNQMSEGLIMIPGRFYLRMQGNGVDAGEAIRGMLVAFDVKRVKELLDVK